MLHGASQPPLTRVSLARPARSSRSPAPPRSCGGGTGNHRPPQPLAQPYDMFMTLARPAPGERAPDAHRRAAGKVGRVVGRERARRFRRRWGGWRLFHKLAPPPAPRAQHAACYAGSRRTRTCHAASIAPSGSNPSRPRFSRQVNGLPAPAGRLRGALFRQRTKGENGAEPEVRGDATEVLAVDLDRSEEHTSELQ